MGNNVSSVVHSKFFIVMLIVLVMFLVTVTGTYAWFSWNSTENTDLTMTIGKFTDVVFTGGNDITTGLTPVFNYYDGENTTFTIKNKSTEIFNYAVYFNIETIDSMLISKDVKYALVKNGTVVAINNLGSASDGTSIKLYSSALTSTIDSFDFYLYIDGNMENNPEMMGKTITGNIMVY